MKASLSEEELTKFTFYRFKQDQSKKFIPEQSPDPIRESSIISQGKISPSPASFSFEEERKIGLDLIHKSTRFNRKKLDKYKPFVDRYGKLKGLKNIEKALQEWNCIVSKDLQINTARSVYSLYNELDQYGYAAYLYNYGKNKGKSSVEDEWFESFKAYYLNESSPSVFSCWLIVLGKAKKKNPDLDTNNFPSPESFKRRLNNEISIATQYFFRNGQSKWNRKYGNYVDRDYSKLKAGQLWVSDHRQTDIIVMYNGKPVRAWKTVWSDAKTRKILSCFLHPEPPNSDHIFQSFYQAVLKHGLPEAILIDNGKDYRCKDFAGRRTSHKVNVDETTTRSMLSLIGVMVHFALPYRAQTKPIERIFKDIITGLEAHLIGYSGGNITKRPEKLKDEIKKGKIYDFEVFKFALNDYIENVYNNMPSQSKALQGKSPNQLWAEDYTEKKHISRDELKLFCMRTSNDVTISKNGVKDSKLNVNYWADWMSAEKGRKVYLRRDIDNPLEGWIFNAKTDEFMGKAEMVEKVDFLAKNDKEKQSLVKAISRDRADIKYNKSLKPSEKDNISEMLENQKAAAKLLSGEIKESRPKVTKVSNSKMSKVIKEAEKLEKKGTFDITQLTCKKPEEPVFFLTEAQKSISEKVKKHAN